MAVEMSRASDSAAFLITDLGVGFFWKYVSEMERNSSPFYTEQATFEL